jgi:hypothetical protein
MWWRDERFSKCGKVGVLLCKRIWVTFGKASPLKGRATEIGLQEFQLKIGKEFLDTVAEGWWGCDEAKD